MDEPAQTVTEKCICCGKELGKRQIYRHLAKLQRRLDRILDGIEPDSGDEDGDEDGAGGDRGRNDGDGGNAEDAEDAEDGEDGDEEPLQPPAGIDIDIDIDIDDADLENPTVYPAPELRRNPPVTIEEWPDPDLSLDVDDDDEPANYLDEPIDGPDRDPEYLERAHSPGLDPENEPLLTDDEIRQLIEADLGDLAEEEWIDIYSRHLTPKDRNTLRFLATRLRTHFSRQTYDDLRRGACEELGIPSEFVAWRRLRILSGLESRVYDCCVNSCCCFLGKYRNLGLCPFCNEARYTPGGKARRYFRYTPLIPQLQGLFPLEE